MRARKTQESIRWEGKGKEERIGEGGRIDTLWFCYDLLGYSWVANFL